jgi:hypothetical protein
MRARLTIPALALISLATALCGVAGAIVWGS